MTECSGVWTAFQRYHIVQFSSYVTVDVYVWVGAYCINSPDNRDWLSCISRKSID